MTSLVYNRRGLKTLEKLDTPAKAQFEEILKEIISNPFKGKRLLGTLAGKYSWRFGDYRVVYTVRKADSETVVVIQGVGHRKNIYQIIERLLLLLTNL